MFPYFLKGGPCQQKHCYNNGKCEADPVSNSATCICPIGYPDENCLSSLYLEIHDQFSITPKQPTAEFYRANFFY